MFGSAVLLGILTAILLGIGWFFFGFIGMFIALVLAIVINFISYWHSAKIVLTMYKAHPLNDKQLQKIVEELAQEANIPTPKLYLVPKQVPNAFATGRDPKHSVIAITQGLLDLDRGEIRGVLAHEMGHIKNRDILISSVAAMIAGAISYIAQIGYFSLFFGGERKGEGNLIGLVFIIIFAPIAALIIRMAISRSREYKADYTAALLTKEPHMLASALKKISQVAKNAPMKGSAATSHMWIANPFHKDWFTSLFSTHPPVEQRVKRLEEMTDWEE